MRLKTYLAVSDDEELRIDKRKYFYEQLKAWRTQARQKLFCQNWYGKFTAIRAFFEFVGGLPGGNSVKTNLRALYDRASPVRGNFI